MTRKLVGFAIAAVCALSATACEGTKLESVTKVIVIDSTGKGGTPSGGPSIVSANLSLTQLFHGTCGAQSGTVTVTTNPAGSGVTITSSNSSVVRVNGNTYTEVGVGNAKIHVALSGTGDFREFDVTVSECGGTGGSLSFSPQNPSGTVGMTLQLVVTCTYSNCDPRFSSSNPGVVSVNATTGLLTFVSVGQAEICVILSPSQPGIKFCGTATSNAGGGQHTYHVNPGNLTQSGCASITFGLRDESNNAVTSGVVWSSTASGMNSSTGVFTPSTPGTFSIMASYQGNTYTTTVTITGTCGGGNNVTVSVNPKTLTLILGGSSGQLTATVTGASPSGTWSLPENKGCVSLSSNGTVATVTPVKLCSEIVRYTQGGVSDQALVTVNAGASSCTWSNASGSNVYNNYTYNQAFQATGSCVYQGVQQQPYWYSKDPSRFTVQGAPYVCMISGVAYPCGTSATIKPIYYGSTDICVQAAVQDNTVFFCRTVSTNPLTAPSGLMAPDWEPNDTREGYEMILPTAPPKGAKVDAVIQWDVYAKSHQK